MKRLVPTLFSVLAIFATSLTAFGQTSTTKSRNVTSISVMASGRLVVVADDLTLRSDPKLAVLDNRTPTQAELVAWLTKTAAPQVDVTLVTNAPGQPSTIASMVFYAKPVVTNAAQSASSTATSAPVKTVTTTTTYTAVSAPVVVNAPVYAMVKKPTTIYRYSPVQSWWESRARLAKLN